MSFQCPRCGTRLVESDDDVCNYELEGSQASHTIKRCAEMEKYRKSNDRCAHGAPACDECVMHDTMLHMST